MFCTNFVILLLISLTNAYRRHKQTTKMLKLYGVPLSQPFRSVAWALLYKRHAFEVVMKVPGMGGKMGAKSPEFMEKAPLATVPVIEEPSGLVLWESPAILAYLADSRGWDDLYPPTSSPAARAKINSFMHWHHHGTRTLANTLTPFFRPDLTGAVDEAGLAQRREAAAKTLETFGDVYLARDGADFIAGSPKVSVADFLAYGEVAQLLPKYCNAMGANHSIPASVAAWCERMQAVPHHDAVNAVLAELGDVTKPNEVAMQKRMASATKVGLGAIVEAAKAIKA
jgi:glutathione S-transferase